MFKVWSQVSYDLNFAKQNYHTSLYFTLRTLHEVFFSFDLSHFADFNVFPIFWASIIIPFSKYDDCRYLIQFGSSLNNFFIMHVAAKQLIIAIVGYLLCSTYLPFLLNDVGFLLLSVSNGAASVGHELSHLSRRVRI